MVMLVGNAEQNGDSLRVIVREVYPMENVREKFTKSVVLSIQLGGVQESAITDVRKIVERYKGNCSCYFHVLMGNDEQPLRMQSAKYIVEPSDQFIAEVETILGPNSVRILS